jgi:hypothetical protein
LPSASGDTTAKKTKKKTAKKTPATTQGRTFVENDWVPPPPPAPYTAYQIPSFDARCIIYPGANYDPWWDMPQLIAQVRVFHFTECSGDKFNPGQRRNQDFRRQIP